MANGRSTPHFIHASTHFPAQRNRGAAASLHTVIAEAILAARSQGLDECRQYHCAVRAVTKLAPDFPLPMAARLINAFLEEQEG